MTAARWPRPAGSATSPQRPDGTLKVRGEFAYSSDLWHEDMIWGATLRSPHPYARIRGVDITEALKVPGVYAVLTHGRRAGHEPVRPGPARPAGAGRGRGALPG